MRIPSGTTDKYIYFIAVDATDKTSRETGLSSFTVVRSRDGAADVTYTTPTITEVDATTMPGLYALLVDEDTTIASGADSEEYALHITHAGMEPVTRTIELYRPKITVGQTLTVSGGVGQSNLTEIDGSASFLAAFAHQLAMAHFGTAQTNGNTDEITLDNAAESTEDNFYCPGVIYIYAGTGAGQPPRVMDTYDASARLGTVSPPWLIIPDNTSDYIVLPAPPQSTVNLPAVNVEQNDGVAITSTSGVQAVNVTQVGGSAQTLPTAASVAAIKSVVDAVLIDTDETIQDLLADIMGATFDTATDSLEAVRNRGDAAWVTGSTPPTAASIRAEIDSNSTQLAAIKAKTDDMVFTVANQLDVNTKSINDVEITGDGQPGTEFGVA